MRQSAGAWPAAPGPRGTRRQPPTTPGNAPLPGRPGTGQLVPVSLGRRVPVGVLAVEKVGRLGPAPVRRQETRRQLRVEEGETAPLVDQPGLGPQRFTAGRRHDGGELIDEVLVPLLD